MMGYMELIRQIPHRSVFETWRGRTGRINFARNPQGDCKG